MLPRKNKYKKAPTVSCQLLGELSRWRFHSEIREFTGETKIK